MSHVRTAVTRAVVSQLHVPRVVSGGHAHTSRGHIPTSGMYIPTSGAYVPTYGVSHGTSHTMTYGPYMGRSMDKVLHLMGAGIKNLLTLQITAL